MCYPFNRSKIKSQKKDNIPVTIGIATLTDNRERVVGISDRMITAGDIEYEPPQPKIFGLTSSIVLMTAGDSSFNAEVIIEVNEIVSKRIQEEPENWWKVAEVAKLFQNIAGKISTAKAAHRLLTPLGLDLDSFYARQQELAPTLVEKLTTELLNFPPPSSQVIVTGVDKTGAHIYVVDSDGIDCFDKLGFACIGAGQWHASSQLMFECYTPALPMFYSMFVSFTAKKRAEVAPGVGSASDMFAIMGLGGFTPIGDHISDGLEGIYRSMREAESNAKREAEASWLNLVQKVINPDEQEQLPEQSAGDGESSADEREAGEQGDESSDGNSSANQKVIRGDSNEG